MKKSNTKQYLILGAVLFVQLCFLVFAGTQKTGFNIDDILSYELSNSYYSPFLEITEDFSNQWHTQEYFLDAISTSSETNFQYGSVYYNQTLDVHPPLYYAALHTVASFFPFVFSKWIGLSVNLMFFLATGVLLFLISKRFFSETYLQLLPTAFWGFSVGAVSTFLLLRMYMMLSCCVALYLYVHISYINGKKMTPLRVLLIIFTIVFGALTHYYFLIFAFFLTASECLLRLIKKDFVQMIVYGITTTVAVGLLFVVYPAAYYHIFAGYRGQESMASAFDFSSYATHIFTTLKQTSIASWSGFVCAGILLLLAVCTILKKYFGAQSIHSDLSTPEECATEPVLLLSMSTLATFVMISILAAYTGARYLFFLYPFSALICVILLDRVFQFHSILQKVKHIYLSAIIVGILAFSWCYETPMYLETQSGAAIAGAKEYSDSSCIYINDNHWKFAGHYIEFMQYEEVLFLKETDLETTLSQIVAPSNESVVVYLPNEADPDSFLQMYHNTQNDADYKIEFLWEYYYSSVYLLTPIDQTD